MKKIKKYKLRKWVENVLLVITIFIGIILVSDATTLKILVLKSFIGLPVLFINCYILFKYGRLNDD